MKEEELFKMDIWKGQKKRECMSYKNWAVYIFTFS